MFAPMTYIDLHTPCHLNKADSIPQHISFSTLSLLKTLAQGMEMVARRARRHKPTKKIDPHKRGGADRVGSKADYLDPRPCALRGLRGCP